MGKGKIEMSEELTSLINYTYAFSENGLSL